MIITSAVLGVIAVLLLLAGAFLAASAVRATDKSLGELQTMAEAFGRGDFSCRVSDGNRDMFGKVAGQFNLAAEKVGEVSGQLLAGITDLVSNAAKLADSASALRQGAGEQTEQTTQAVAAMDAISRTIHEVACNSMEASQVSQNGQETAMAGNEVVVQTVRSMESIAQSVANCSRILEELGRHSGQIGQIVNVIEDIADQTNLLALNAAIEAARAGEQGRGFAVVADEVRNLASRTTIETSHIAQLIREMQTNASRSVDAMREGTDRVEEGRQNASHAISSLDAILQASGNALRLVNQISTSAEEQAAVTTEVTTSMEMINMISQMAESSVNEIAESSRQFLQLATGLEKTAAWFGMVRQTTKQGDGTWH